MAAAEEVMQGIWEADLGSGVIKNVYPPTRKEWWSQNNYLLNQQIMCFYDGWSKSGLSSKGTKEIEDDELAAYKNGKCISGL